MKKNITIIILSVCLALTVLVSVVLCLYLPHRQARLAEQVWAEYLFWLDYIDYIIRHNPRDFAEVGFIGKGI